MEFEIEIPEEIKPNIIERLNQNGSLKSLNRKVKMGMMIAIQEIRENRQSQSYLTKKPFENSSPYEMKALQSVFDFLSTHNLFYTLATLFEESAIRKSGEKNVDVIDLIDHHINHPENPQIPEDDHNYRPVISNTTQHTNPNTTNYSDNHKSSSKTFFNLENVQNDRKKEKNLGIEISRSTFERSKLIVSVVNI